MSAVGPLALPRTSKMCVVVAARRHPLHKCAMMQPRGCGSRDVPRSYRQPEAHSRRHLSVLRMGPCRGLGWSVPCAHGLCQSEAQSAAPPHFATPTRPFSLSRRSKPSPSPRSAAFMAGGARSLARCLLALAASGGGSVVVCRLKANTHNIAKDAKFLQAQTRIIRVSDLCG